MYFIQDPQSLQKNPLHKLKQRVLLLEKKDLLKWALQPGHGDVGNLLPHYLSNNLLASFLKQTRNTWKKEKRN